MSYHDSDAARLHAFELRNHRLVRVLLLNPFQRRSRMIQLPALDSIDNQALEGVMQVSTARHSYRDNVQVQFGDMRQPTYKMATWTFDRVVRIPGVSFAMTSDSDSETVVGISVLCKYQLCWWSMFTAEGSALPTEMRGAAVYRVPARST